jgi:hypothetical protein
MTGEMGFCDIQPGGEHYEWAMDLRRAAQSLCRRLKFWIRVVDVRPFDVYQGPYVRLTHGSLWSGPTERPDNYFYDGAVDVEGTIPEIAAALKTAMKEGKL